MSRECEICGKRPVLGNSITTRGRAKYLGGVGTKVTGISRRPFRPNLQRVKITDAKGTPRTVRVCTRCIRSGVIVKKVQSAPFRLPPGDAANKGSDAPQTGKSRKRKKKS